MQHNVEINMNQPFEKWTEVSKKVQAPLQAMAELNVKTLQGFTFLKPEELATIKKPEELLEKQINITVKNGHIALDYMRDSFQLLEDSMLSLVKEVRNNTQSAKK